MFGAVDGGEPCRERGEAGGLRWDCLAGGNVFVVIRGDAGRGWRLADERDGVQKMAIDDGGRGRRRTVGAEPSLATCQASQPAPASQG